MHLKLNFETELRCRDVFLILISSSYVFKFNMTGIFLLNLETEFCNTASLDNEKRKMFFEGWHKWLVLNEAWLLIETWFPAVELLMQNIYALNKTI